MLKDPRRSHKLFERGYFVSELQGRVGGVCQNCFEKWFLTDWKRVK